MSESKYFNKINITDIKDIKITAIDLHNNYLITGDANGVVHTYEIKPNNKFIQAGEITTKNKIDQIITLSNLNICLILSAGELLAANLPSLNNKTQLIKSGIEKLFINSYNKECKNQVMVVTKKKKLKIYDINSSQNNITLADSKNKEISIEEIPNCGEWINNSLIYSNTSKTFWLDLYSNKSTPVELNGILQIFNLEGKIGLVNNEVTIFMKDGKSYPYNPIIQSSKEFVYFTVFKNYLIGLYKNSINIFKKGEQSCVLIETIELNNNDGQGKYMVSSDNKVIICTDLGNKSNIIDFQEKPYEEQVKLLIGEKKYNEALEKLIDNVSEDDDNKQEKLEEFYLDCAWTCIKDENKQYDLAIKFLNLTNFNPYEFIYMFYDSLNINIIHADKKQDLIDHKNENQLINVNSSDNEDEKKKFTFLINVLMTKRDYIINRYKLTSAENEKEKINFISSKYGRINLSDSKIEITVRDVLDSINSTLLKSLIKLQKNPRDIESVLDNKSINYEIFQNLENDAFFTDDKNKNLDETKFALAYISEKKGDFEKALKEWEYFGKRNIQNDKYSVVGRERTKKIFYKFKDNKTTDRLKKEELFKKYIKWLLKKNQNEAFEVLIKTELITINAFIEEIIPEVEKNKEEPSVLKEKLLEYCNQNNKNENYQTQLLLLYADKMFSYISKDKTDFNKEKDLQGDLKKYYDLFLKIIKEPDCCYNKRTILEYIEKSWLKEPKIYLYSQLKEHEKALTELFNDAKITHIFDDIEKYCTENTKSKPDIFQNLYKLLSDVVNTDCQIIDLNIEKIDKYEKKLLGTTQIQLTDVEKKEYNDEIQKLRNEIKKLEDSKKPFEDEMLKILKNYGTIENLDPLFVLNYINEHINLCENNDFFKYLTNIITEYTEEGNKYKITKNLSEMGLVYKEKETLDYEKKFVTIDSEKTCDLCKKKIGNSFFVIYPNLRVYHSKCVVNYNIDPMTGVDFSKKKYVE
jgi:hypothetical protein